MKSNIIYLEQVAPERFPRRLPQLDKSALLENLIPFWLVAWIAFGLIESFRMPFGF